LDASIKIGLKTIPARIYKGYTDEEIAFLSDYDNENDEYHKPVPIVDVWAEYARLGELGWTQERIAKAKDIDRTMVSRRVN
jgi:hypothetical protein